MLCDAVRTKSSWYGDGLAMKALSDALKLNVLVARQDANEGVWPYTKVSSCHV